MTAELRETSPAAEPTRPPRGLLKRLVLGRPSDPVWARPALWAVLVLAALLYSWDLSRNGDANTFYAAAVLSGTESWKAFFYGSLDSASFITVDKPPFAFWVMGISARIFGFSSWSLLLPQAAEGVAAVAVVYAAVRRSVAGLHWRARRARGRADRGARPDPDPRGRGDRPGQQPRHDADAAAGARRMGAA